MTDTFRTLRYQAGPRPPGRAPRVRTLEVSASGALRLEVAEGAARTVWDARLADPPAATGPAAPTVVERIDAALADAGFPAQPPPVARRPGDTVRLVHVTAGTGDHTVTIEYRRAERLPGWSELFRILDSLVAQIGGAEAALRHGFLPPVVAQVRRR